MNMLQLHLLCCVKQKKKSIHLKCHDDKMFQLKVLKKPFK